MEAGGHYYTVYYTSLAVGYNQDLAYQHALLAQMPDQVAWLDAAHMQTTELGHFAGNPHQCGSASREIDLRGFCREVIPFDRAKVQYGSHALVPNHLSSIEKSSAYQRSFTVEKLKHQSPDSLEFGILLHRLGDTFAHSKKRDNSVMYQISSSELFTWSMPNNSAGHLHDFHYPDFPFLRINDIFIPYLQQLYLVLYNKLNEHNNLKFKRPGYTPMPFGQLKASFENIFANLNIRQKQFGETHFHYTRGGIKIPDRANNDEIDRWFIAEIRAAMSRMKGITIRSYDPENRSLVSLRQFLNEHPELKRLNINADTLNTVLDDIMPGGEQSLIPPVEKSYLEQLKDYMGYNEYMQQMNREIYWRTMPRGFP